MSLTAWAAFGDIWAEDGKVTFNGQARTINVNADVTILDLRQDVYSAWVRWTAREPWAPPAMRFSGADPIPGGETGVSFFLLNGWKLCYDANAVAVAGVLFSEDYPTAYWSTDAQTPIYPATVSSLVNSAVSYQNVVTGTALTPEQTATAVWGAAARTLTTSLDPNAAQIAAAVLAEILASVVPANIKQVNAVPITGNGQPATPWGPA